MPHDSFPSLPPDMLHGASLFSGQNGFVVNKPATEAPLRQATKDPRSDGSAWTLARRQNALEEARRALVEQAQNISKAGKAMTDEKRTELQSLQRRSGEMGRELQEIRNALTIATSRPVSIVTKRAPKPTTASTRSTESRASEAWTLAHRQRELTPEADDTRNKLVEAVRRISKAGGIITDDERREAKRLLGAAHKTGHALQQTNAALTHLTSQPVGGHLKIPQWPRAESSLSDEARLTKTQELTALRDDLTLQADAARRALAKYARDISKVDHVITDDERKEARLLQKRATDVGRELQKTQDSLNRLKAAEPPTAMDGNMTPVEASQITPNDEIKTLAPLSDKDKVLPIDLNPRGAQYREMDLAREKQMPAEQEREAIKKNIAEFASNLNIEIDDKERGKHVQKLGERRDTLWAQANAYEDELEEEQGKPKISKQRVAVLNRLIRTTEEEAESVHAEFDYFIPFTHATDEIKARIETLEEKKQTNKNALSVRGMEEEIRKLKHLDGLLRVLPAWRQDPKAEKTHSQEALERTPGALHQIQEQRATRMPKEQTSINQPRPDDRPVLQKSAEIPTPIEPVYLLHKKKVKPPEDPSPKAQKQALIDARKLLQQTAEALAGQGKFVALPWQPSAEPERPSKTSFLQSTWGAIKSGWGNFKSLVTGEPPSLMEAYKIQLAAYTNLLLPEIPYTLAAPSGTGSGSATIAYELPQPERERVHSPLEQRSRRIEEGKILARDLPTMILNGQTMEGGRTTPETLRALSSRFTDLADANADELDDDSFKALQTPIANLSRSRISIRSLERADPNTLLSARFFSEKERQVVSELGHSVQQRLTNLEAVAAAGDKRATHSLRTIRAQVGGQTAPDVTRHIFQTCCAAITLTKVNMESTAQYNLTEAYAQRLHALKTALRLPDADGRNALNSIISIVEAVTS